MEVSNRHYKTMSSVYFIKRVRSCVMDPLATDSIYQSPAPLIRCFLFWESDQGGFHGDFSRGRKSDMKLFNVKGKCVCVCVQ